MNVLQHLVVEAQQFAATDDNDGNQRYRHDFDQLPPAPPPRKRPTADPDHLATAFLLVEGPDRLLQRPVQPSLSRRQPIIE